MASINKDLGAVTAYGFAKDGGYTGTVQQFESDLASIGSSLAGKADLVNGKVPASELPSFVDDVIEGYYDSTADKFYEDSLKTEEITPEAGKIYVDLGSTPSATYRWSGSTYTPVGNGSGHTILNSSGTEMTQRDDLQFVGATVSDDSTNGRTVVTVNCTGHTIKNSSGTSMTQRSNLQFTSKVKDDSGNDKTIVYSGSEEVVTIGHTTGSSGTNKWLTQNTTIDGTVYGYKYSATLTKPIYGAPVIDRVATVGGSTTSAQITAYNCVAYVGHDPDYPTTLNLYASSVPTVDFSLLVRWEGGEV